MSAPPPSPTWSDITAVNLDKAWNVLCRLEREQLLVLFARTLRFVPTDYLEQIFMDHAHPHEIGDAQPVERQPLLDTVREFADAALRGEFYQDFRINSQNFTDTSAGTQTFEAQLDLLFDRCVEEAVTGNSAEACVSYERLFDLLREIDKFEKDIVFFADEGGVWQFNLNWKRILPGYFRGLTKTLRRDDFERQVESLIEEFVDPWCREDLRKAASEAIRSAR